MPRTAIISVDGHVRASCKGYRDYVEKRYLNLFDGWAKAEEEAGTPESGGLSPGVDSSAQWDSDRRLDDMEGQGVVAEVLFPEWAAISPGSARGSRSRCRSGRRSPVPLGLQPVARRLLRGGSRSPGRPGGHIVRRH